MRYIEKKLERMDSILKQIEETQPNLRADTVKQLAPEMI